jgi:hypothetical protein
LYAECPAQGSGKLAGEAWVSVGDDSFGQTEEGKEMRKIESSHLRSIYGLSAGEKFGCLRASLIDDH